MGITLAEKIQEEVRLERAIVREERDAGLLSSKNAQGELDFGSGI